MLAATPVVSAESAERDHPERKIRVSSVSLYDEPDRKEYFVNPPGKLEGYIRDARVFVTDLKRQYQPVIDKSAHIYETGVAHSKEAVATLRQEDNIIDRIGLMTLGGVLGLFAARRRSFLRKLAYLSVGVAGTGAVCYPAESKVLAKEAMLQTRKGALVAYHFITGVRPEVANQNGEAFDKVANMVSDVWLWGFRLLNGSRSSQTAPVEGVAESAPEPAPAPSELISQAAELDKEELEAEAEPQSASPEASESKSVVVVEGDMGQASLEDRELYTTRG